MKKSLYMTTALAAAGVLALGATDAAAAEKAKKMSIANGGFFKTTFGFSKNDGSYESTNNATARTHYDSFDIKNDSEIYFKGKTTLDSGVKVDVVVQFETDATNGGATIDESYIKFTTKGFGHIALGTTKAGSFFTKHVSPLPGAVGFNPDTLNWVSRPAALGYTAGTNIGAGDAMKIRYVSESFSGFTLGGSYTPSNTANNLMPAVGGTAGTETQTYDIGLKYKTKMGASSVGVDVGYWETHGAAANSLKSLRFGGELVIGDIKIGGAYKDTSDLDSASSLSGDPTNESEAYEVGIQYTAGDVKIGLAYINEVRPMTATAGDDEETFYALGASYKIGNGVDLLGTLIRVDWDDEGTALANNNDGWALVGGIKVSF